MRIVAPNKGARIEMYSMLDTVLEIIALHMSARIEITK